MSSPVRANTANGATDSAALAAAFETFNQVSRELEASYENLEREAARLRLQLRSANQRSAEESRRNAELAQRLSALLEALPGGVLLLDGDGQVQEANAAASALLGETALGARWTDLRERALSPADGGQGDLELRDGRRVNLAQKPLHPGPGRVLLLTDVTEKRKIEDLLARHRRLAAMGEMAAALAHQIRTPLAAALLYATNARRSALPSEQRDMLLGKSIGCLNELERLIGDMLQFARGATLSGQRFSLNDLLESVENSLRPFVPADVTFRIVSPAQEFPLCGNRETLAGALLNLATNAMHAAGSGGNVQIVARILGAHAEINVIDSGGGIPDALRTRVFEPFFTSRADGTGLGLAVARSIARAHRGDVTLLDGSPGRTTFSLSMPAAAPDAVDSSHDRSAA